LFLAGDVLASEENDFIYQASVEKTMDQVYDNVYKALEEARFYIIFEANIGKTWHVMQNVGGMSTTRINLKRLKPW